MQNYRKISIQTNGETKILFGGPPCQGFSTSNQRTRTSENPQNWLFLEFIRIAKIWNPEWIVLENVRGIIETEGGKFFKAITESIEKIGYTTSAWVLNAADYRVPQKRFRLFIIGSLHGKIVSPPHPCTTRHITVREAISDLPVLPNGGSEEVLPYQCAPNGQYAKKMRGRLKYVSNHQVTRNSEIILERYRHIPPGGNWTHIPTSLMGNYKDPSKCHTGIYHRLKYGEPSIVNFPILTFWMRSGIPICKSDKFIRILDR